MNTLKKLNIPLAGDTVMAANGDVYEVTKFVIKTQKVSVKVTPANSEVGVLTKEITHEEWKALKGDLVMTYIPGELNTISLQGEVTSQSDDVKSGEGDHASGESSPVSQESSPEAQVVQPSYETYEVGTKYRDMRNYPYTVTDIADGQVKATSFRDNSVSTFTQEQMDALFKDGHHRVVPQF